MIMSYLQEGSGILEEETSVQASLTSSQDMT